MMSTGNTSHVSEFVAQLEPITFLQPRVEGNKRVAQPSYTQQGVCIVGVKTTVGRFLPVSHEGHGIETFVDKADVLGKTRAEFIGKKLKGIERRAHMRFYRELLTLTLKKNQRGQTWEGFFKQHFDKECMIPNALCTACWNCSLFGGMEAGKYATQARIRYFDTYSVQGSEDCIASAESDEGMGIGNQVYEDVNKARDSASYHLYEYVKAETAFPFITMIENATVLDVAGYLAAIRRADVHGYGRYSANHGKFTTKILAVASGAPRFSVFELVQWGEQGRLEEVFRERQVTFDFKPNSILLSSYHEFDQLEAQFDEAFEQYVGLLQK